MEHHLSIAYVTVCLFVEKNFQTWKILGRRHGPESLGKIP